MHVIRSASLQLKCLGIVFELIAKEIVITSLKCAATLVYVAVVITNTVDILTFWIVPY